MMETRLVSTVKCVQAFSFVQQLKTTHSFQVHIELCRIPFLLHVAQPSDPSRTHLAVTGGLARPERLIKSMGKSHHPA